MSEIKVGIALGGGGALGMAHIGVLKALNENGINPSIVVGTSIGSLVGGVYACGLPLTCMEKQALKVKTSQLFDLSLSPSGLLGGANATKLVKHIIKEDVNIENLNIKYAAVAADINTGAEVLLDSGSILKAIRASISVPGVFVPCKINGQTLVDGGILNNLPEDHVKNMGADVVLSVNLLSDFIPYTTPKTAIHAMAFSFLITQKKLVETKKNYSDLRINLPLKDYRQYIFNPDKTEELIEIGYNETIKLIPEIKKIIKAVKSKKK